MTVQDAGTTGDLLDRADDEADHRSLYAPLARLMRVMHAMKTQLAGSDVSRERAAHVLLFPLVDSGPLRQGALAELVHADPSTVSRHVSLLVERGLVRRIADAADGRASQLMATPAGEAALRQLRSDRQQVLDRVTASWSPADLAAFTDLMDRFVADLGAVLVSTAPTGSPTPETTETNDR